MNTSNVAKFLAIAESANDLDRKAARDWYSEANDLAQHLTTLGDLDFDQAACIIAVFSIRQRWSKNVELATRFASGERDLPVMGAINRIAENIITYDDPYSALHGDKTNAFAHNIAGDILAVTIDVWMIRAVDGDTSKSLGKKAYRDLANDLTAAALDYGMYPAAFQALVWILVRGKIK